MDQAGVVFNIQKFSIHDGPGIRTTVFLKGCPLRCAWCANPESQLSKVQIMYDAEKCLHCGKCMETCPEQAISMQTNSRIHIDFKKCIGCLSCTHICPGRALTHEGEHKTAEEVFQICMQDELFYEESGGGVTISGGEGMLQPDFTEALIRKLKAHRIHTAIETTGYIKPDVFQRLAPQFDLLLFDVKHYDSVQHHRGTGVHNEQIIENLTWAHDHGIDILPRVAVIPGFNDKPEDAAGIAALLNHIGLKRVQLLPFHQMGERKYEFLNRSYAMAGIKNLYAEDLKGYQKIFLNAGLDCFI
jgi:pyruvate formate lyase activating enzyme